MRTVSVPRACWCWLGDIKELSVGIMVHFGPAFARLDVQALGNTPAFSVSINKLDRFKKAKMCFLLSLAQRNSVTAALFPAL